jgi:hypothetical protein
MCLPQVSAYAQFVASEAADAARALAMRPKARARDPLARGATSKLCK